LVYLFCCQYSIATIFLPISIDKQVEEATFAVEAKLSNSRVFKDESGKTMTEFSFDILAAYNFSNDESGEKQLKLTMPGGTYDGVTSAIDGAPQFNKNEKIFLLLKKVDSKIYLSNFTLGKYRVQEVEDKTYYVSEVFPTNPKIGRIQKEKMIELMNEKWKLMIDDYNKITKTSKVLFKIYIYYLLFISASSYLRFLSFSYVSYALSLPARSTTLSFDDL
jgi:hypothetical protein